MSGDKGEVNREVDAEIPSCPNGLFNFPPGSVVVQDADEEVHLNSRLRVRDSRG